MADEFSMRVNQILDCLSTDECKALLFLISDLVSGECVKDCRGALITLITHTQTHTDTPAGWPPPSDTVLQEVLFRLKRFDILRNVLGTSRQDVEELLRRKGRVLSDYRVLMMELSESLESDELCSLTFLLSRTIPKGPLNRAVNFLDIVVELEKMDKISSENLEMVEQCFRNIQRMDLANKIQSYLKGQHRLVNTKPDPKPDPRSPREENTQPGLSHNHQIPVKNQRLAEGFESLKLSVAESAEQCSQDPVDEYSINSELRGVCVIIDCIGSDGHLLKQTFEQLGFRVDLHTLLSAEEVFSVLRSMSQQAVLHRVSFFSCCLLSRATETHLLATDSEGQGLALHDLRQLFGPVQCPLLVGKPKLFFMQSYSSPETPPTPGQHDHCLETDGVPFHDTRMRHRRETVPAAADALWSVCKAETCLLERSDHRSIYLQALSSALLRAQDRRIPILNALIEVNRDVYEYNQRNPDKTYHITVSHTLRKNLYL